MNWRARARLSLALLVLILFAVALIAPAFAQTGPFGAPRPPASLPANGIVGWILAKQAMFYSELSGLVRAARTNGSAVWTLLALSFGYGIFHAAGPGHGKAVISSYMVANNETWRRGVILSFVSAMLQALVAIVLVAIAAGIIGATRKTMDATVRWIEIASYGLIALVGLQLIWTKGCGFLRAWQEADHDRAHHHDHACSDHDHQHDHHHNHDDHTGHSHGPEPQELAGPGGWQRGFHAIVAVGLRPCSGAILVLVFALSQGMFWAGIGATFMIGLGTALTVAMIATLAVSARSLAGRFARENESGNGALVVRGLEIAAALVVFVFGVALLTGYMVSERMI